MNTYEHTSSWLMISNHPKHYFMSHDVPVFWRTVFFGWTTFLMDDWWSWKREWNIFGVWIGFCRQSKSLGLNRMLVENLLASPGVATSKKKKLTKIGWSTPKRSSIPIMFHQISWDSDETPHFFWHFTDILLCLDPPMAMAMILPPDHQGQHEPLEPLQGRRPSGARDVLAARGHGERAEAADDGLPERRRGAGLATPRWRCPLVELCVARDGKQRKIDWSPLWGHRFQYNYIYI